MGHVRSLLISVLKLDDWNWNRTLATGIKFYTIAKRMRKHVNINMESYYKSELNTFMLV